MYYNFLKYGSLLSVNMLSGPFAVGLIISILGHESSEALTIFFIIISVFSVIFTISSLCLSSITNLVAESTNSEKKFYLNNLFVSGGILASILIIVSIILSLLIPEFVYPIIAADIPIHRLSAPHYLFILAIPLVISNAFLGNFLIGLHLYGLTAKITIADSIIQVTLSYIFIHFFDFDLVVSVILAFIISDLIVLFVLIIKISDFFRKGILLFTSFSHFKYSIIKEIFALGSPRAIGTGLQKISTSIVTFILLPYNDMANIYNIVLNMSVILLIPVSGISQHISILISKNMTAKNPKYQDAHILKVSLLLSFLILFFIVSLYLLFSRNIIGFFVENEETINAIYNISTYVIVYFFISSLLHNFIPFLRAKRDVLFPQILVNISSYAIFIPLIFLISIVVA